MRKLYICSTSSWLLILSSELPSSPLSLSPPLIQENIEALADELRSPKYNGYFVCESVSLCLSTPAAVAMVSLSDFSNKLDRPGLKTLAEADQLESVREIKVRLSHLFFTVLRYNMTV